MAARSVDIRFDSASLPRASGIGARARRTARRYPLGVLGLLLLIGFFVLGVLGPAWAPYDPRALRVGPALGGPSVSYPFGLNSLGEDLYSRVLAGARTSLEISAGAVIIGGTIGTMLGIYSGFRGGRVDFLLQRAAEAFVAFPNLILFLMLAAAFGRGPYTFLGALTIGAIFGGHRVIRAATIIERHAAYVEASRSVGCPETRIFFRHIVPNVLPISIILASGALGATILAESSLAFLGLGVAPGTPSWGNEMSGSAVSFARLGYWNLVVFPGLAISLVVLGANLFGDALRDLWDPRLRGRR